MDVDLQLLLLRNRSYSTRRAPQSIKCPLVMSEINLKGSYDKQHPLHHNLLDSAGGLTKATVALPDMH